jgi:hypothetical protein
MSKTFGLLMALLLQIFIAVPCARLIFVHIFSEKKVKSIL